ncbi:MAG: O-antigen ligase family protein [Candidatus Magasanikbacteria bacterium]
MLLKSSKQNSVNKNSFFTKGIIGAGLLIILSAFLWNLSPIYLILTALVFFWIFMVCKPKWIVYLITAFALPIGFRLDLSQFNFILENIPRLAILNAPWVDFIALGGVSAFAVSVFLQVSNYRFRQLLQQDYRFKFLLPFLVSGLLSSLFIFIPGRAGDAFYYFLRNIVFIYLAFVVLPVAVIQDRELLEKVLWVFFWAGFFVACFGLVAFIRDMTFGGWPRVVPFSIGGFAPLKYNHNILAESLVAVVPISAYLSVTRSRTTTKKLMFGATSFIALICVLTLSRAAWLALFVQGILTLFVFKKRVKNLLERKPEIKYALISLIVPVAGYMLYFLTSHIVISSNVWRIEVLKIVWFHFKSAPLLGYGPGTYLTILEQVKAYTINFGEPLDAHGFVQKILLEQGLVGLITFVSFLAAVFYRVWCKQRKAHVGRLMIASLLISAVGAVFFQLFNTSYYNAHMWLPIGLALAGANVFEGVRF